MPHLGFRSAEFNPDEIGFAFHWAGGAGSRIEAYKIFDSLNDSEEIYLDEPIRYIEFTNLVFSSRLLITDSGGIQEETTYLGIPCLTLRPNTGRPITIAQGTNRLCSTENVGDNI